MRSVEETEAPKGTRRTRLNAAQRRESILAAAVEVFSASGYRAGKVSDVAALVGVSEPVIFQNFGSKAALFAAVVDRVAGDVQAELERMAGQPDTDPEPVAWLLLSVLSTRAFRAVVTPGPDRVEAGVTALALRLLAPGD